MLTNKITEFSADLLNTVRGILGEAKKHTDDCECEKCEAEEMEEGHMPTADEPTDANKKTADKVRAMMAKEKKLKEDIMEMVNEASDGLSDKAKKSGVSLSTLKKVYARGIAAWNSGHRPGTTPQQWAHARVNSYITKGKGTYHGADKDLRSEGTDMPFEKPYKKVGERKDEYGNKVKNVAKYLAKKAMNKQKNEEVEQIDEVINFKALDVVTKGHAGKSYSDTFNAHGNSIHNKIKDVRKERDEQPGTTSHATFLHDKMLKAYASWYKNKKANEETEQIDEISAKTAVNAYAKRNAKAFNDGQYDDEAEKDYNKLDKQGDRIKRKFGAKIVQKAQKAASKKIFGEEHEEDDGWYTHSQMHGSKKSEKHPKGISAIEWKSGIRWHHGKNKRINVKEEIEQIDEAVGVKTKNYDPATATKWNRKGSPLKKQPSAHAHEIAAEHHDELHHEWKAQYRDHKAHLTPIGHEGYKWEIARHKKAAGEHKLAAKNFNAVKEEVEQVDELSKDTMLRYLSGNKKNWYGPGGRDVIKRMRGTDMAVRKYTAKPGSKSVRVPATEEVEQIDELSKGTMGRYINKAKDSIDIVSYRQGHKEAHGSSAAGAEKKLTKRHKGISTAVSKLTKEEQDFVDSLNNEIFEKADPYDIAGMIKKAKAKNDPNHPAMKHVAAIEDMKKHGGALSVQGDHVRSLIKALGEDVEITEARGRPRKAGAKDFTIHPKTKEKLMHNNPEHMKKIEVLQKNRVLDKPKVEASQHIMNQLSKAKTSMLGGSKIHFTHGDSKEVSGPHAAKILTKYAGMKPDEKETFQKFVGHSHENLMKHV